MAGVGEVAADFSPNSTDVGSGFLFTLLLLSVLSGSSDAQPRNPNSVVAQDGSGNFTTIAEALQAAPDNSPQIYYIKIRPGKYMENVIVDITKTNIAFLGEGMDTTIISGNKSFGAGYQTSQTATVVIKAPGFIAMDVTFENTAGPYYGQALALTSENDYIAFYRCRFLGYQDTLNPQSGIQFFRECEIYGTVDFIFGDATVVMQNSIIYARKPLDGQSNVITAQGRSVPTSSTGTVIQNCSIKAAPDLLPYKSQIKTYLGRPWKDYSRSIIMQSNLGDFIDPAGWLQWEGAPNRSKTAYYVEYDNTGPGANTAGRVQWPGYHIQTNPTTVMNFTVRNFIRGDRWIPKTGIPFFLDLM
ncbi:pectinesterase-like [Malania oleifera]|uniref:pectinesterase-like n=1 Tax=Malania oleifera TaxID=397392 RepID=UPI0025AE1193|nr:pectinesterase-like [Malania oleifera]